MKQNVAEGLLIILDSVGLKPVATEDMVLLFIGYSTGGDQPNTGDTNPTTQAEICSDTSFRALKIL